MKLKSKLTVDFLFVCRTLPEVIGAEFDPAATVSLMTVSSDILNSIESETDNGGGMSNKVLGFRLIAQIGVL